MEEKVGIIKAYINKHQWTVVGTVLAIVVLALILVLLRCNSYRATVHEQENIIAALNDTLVVTRDASGKQTATIMAFKTRQVKDILKIKSKDSSIIWLQSVLKQHSKELGSGGTAAVFSANTSIKATSKTLITKVDTVIKDKQVFIFPEYTSSFQLGKWARGNTRANKDSTFVSLKTYNEYEAVIGQTGNIFKGYKPFVEITTASPYDSIRTVRAYLNSAPRPKRFGIGIIAGYGIAPTQSTGFTYLLGLGVSYNLIRF